MSTDAEAVKDKVLYLTRHAEGHHNVDEKTHIRDAKLTPLGRLQAKHLNELTESTLQTTAELLVCSIQRRPMNTARLGYPSLHSRLAKEGKPPIVLDILQEVDDAPSDTPTYPPDDIRKDPDFTEYLKDVDLQGLDPMYATKKGVFHPDRAGERAEMVRRWLYKRPEREIVVAAHCDILRWIVDAKASDRDWTNAEVKAFTFASSDMSAPLSELQDVKGAKPAATVNRDELEAEEEHDWEEGLEREKQEAWDAKPDQESKEDTGDDEKSRVQHVKHPEQGKQALAVAA